MQQVAVVIPFDPYNQNYMIVRSTNWHPIPSMRHKLKGIGGMIESEEDSYNTMCRELEEELPGWFTHIPGTGKSWGTAGNKVLATNGFASYGFPIHGQSVSWHLYVIPTDLGIKSFHHARSVATESTPEIWSTGQIPEEKDCVDGFQKVIMSAISLISGAYRGPE